MKKLFAALLSLTMLFSAVIAFAVPALAVDGAWTVYGPASQYATEFDGDPKSVAGYEYNEDGFHLVPADWKGTTPWALIQTKEKFDLKEGVYLQFRVDEFSLEATDKWLNVNFWDSAMLEPPVEGYGEGVQTLMRIKKYDNINNDLKTIEWYTQNFTGKGRSDMTADKNLKTADGKFLVDVTLTWNGTSYALEINGAAASNSVITYMNEKWGGEDSTAYIGVCAQNNVTGGTVELTVTKFGTTKANATTPKGDDKRKPENYTFDIAPIASPDEVPANQPAVFMNGNRIDSDLKTMPKPIYNSTLSINDDYSLRVTANAVDVDSGVWYVKNSVSYDIKDFPIGLLLTKNYCSCGYEDGRCYAVENANVYMLTGDSTAIGGNHVNDLSMCQEPYKIGDDSYLYFYVDMMNDPSFEASGRINGACYDFTGIDHDTPDANAFDIVFMAWFRSVEEAEAFVEAYLAELGWVSDDPEPEEETTTEEIEEVITESFVEETYEKLEESEEETKTQTEEKPQDKKEDGGCGSTVSAGIFAIILLSTGVVFFKKKNH